MLTLSLIPHLGNSQKVHFQWIHMAKSNQEALSMYVHLLLLFSHQIHKCVFARTYLQICICNRYVFASQISTELTRYVNLTPTTDLVKYGLSDWYFSFSTHQCVTNCALGPFFLQMWLCSLAYSSNDVFGSYPEFRDTEFSSQKSFSSNSPFKDMPS